MQFAVHRQVFVNKIIRQDLHKYFGYFNNQSNCQFSKETSPPWRLLAWLEDVMVE